MKNLSSLIKFRGTSFNFSKIAVFLIIFVSSQNGSKAQVIPQEISDSLQSILNNSLPQGVLNPGAVMSVYVPGQWTWTSSSGHAISGMTPGHTATLATPTHKFRIGSISKTFVATAIMLLEEQGLLNIEDTIGKYLRPGLMYDTIMSSEPVRIRHLLNHTSGIDNSADNSSCQQNALANLTAPHTLEEAIYCGASQGEIFPAEFAWAYSNTNYSILAMIIQEVSGQTSMDYIRQHILIPQGLTETDIPTTDEISTPHMGCYWNIGFWIDMTVVDPSLYWGWADIVSTTTDLNKFYDALLSGQIVNQNSLNKMMTMYPGTYDYGLGLDFYTIGNSNTPYFGHSGEVGNSSSMFFAETSTSAFPDGYYVSYNFNYQGVDMGTKIDEPVFDLMNRYITSINNQTSLSPVISVFPNPVQDFINIDINWNSEKQCIFVLTDITGKIVLQENLDIQLGNNHYTIPITKISSGSYFYQVHAGEYMKNGKIVKLN